MMSEDKMIQDLVDELIQQKTDEEKGAQTDAQKTDMDPIQEEKKDVKEKKSEVKVPNDLNQLFSGLIKNFIPPELKNNKEVDQMLNLMFSAFSPNQDVKKDEPKEPLQESKEEVEDEEDQDLEDEEDQDLEDDENENENGDEDEDEEDDGNEEEEVEDSNEEDEDEENVQSENLLYLVKQNDHYVGYTSSYKKAMSSVKELYRQFRFHNEDRYLRVVRSCGSIKIYERQPFSLFPFQEQFVCEMKIEVVPSM
jgi:hypothetical protein